MSGFNLFNLYSSFCSALLQIPLKSRQTSSALPLLRSVQDGNSLGTENPFQDMGCVDIKFKSKSTSNKEPPNRKELTCEFVFGTPTNAFNFKQKYPLYCTIKDEKIISMNARCYNSFELYERLNKNVPMINSTRRATL